LNEHIQIILGAMLFKDSPWFSEPRQQSGKQRYTWRKSLYRHFWNMAIDRCRHTVAWILKRCTHHQDWRWTKDVPEGNFHIIIFWNMAIDRCGHTVAFEWMSERHPPRRLIMGQFVLKPNTHFTAWVWVI
jgi:hypothetical protein